MSRASTLRACLFPALATLAFAAAMLPPIDTLAESYFSAHMVQHLILVAVLPPLIVLSRPGALLRLLPRDTSSRLISAIRPITMLFAGARRAPWSIWWLHVVTMWAWHLPVLYSLAMTHPVMHLLEHVTFILTATLLWWLALRPVGFGAARYAMGGVLLVATALQGTLLGAFLFFSSVPRYLAGHTVPGMMTPLQDQRLAGLIMWVPGGLVYLAVAAALFIKWFSASHRALRPAALQASTAASLMIAACGTPSPAVRVTDGDANRGRVALSTFSCGACHEIRGVSGAHGRVGPSLDGLASRSLIAGEAPNTAENLVRWIRDPQSIEPNTAMPNLQVSLATARDMAAYLYSVP